MNKVIPHPSTLQILAKVNITAGKQIQIINAQPIFDELFNGHHYESESWATASQLFINWCQAYGVYYYGRSKTEFDLNEAIKLAEKKKCTYLIVEDLS